jgi:hypothetical protein
VSGANDCGAGAMYVEVYSGVGTGMGRSGAHPASSSPAAANTAQPLMA